MIPYKEFTLLNEVKGDGIGGYKLPIDLGSGWEKNGILLGKKDFVRIGKGKYKGYITSQPDESWIKQYIPNVGVDRAPWVDIGIGSDIKSAVWIGRVVAPLSKNGRAPSGKWTVMGITNETSGVIYAGSLKKVGETRTMIDAIKLVIEKAAKVSPDKTPGPASPVDTGVDEALSKIKAFLGSQARINKDNFNPSDIAVVEVRYWGNWEVPPGEDDDGDYDWEVPTNATSKKIKDFIDKLNKSLKKYKATWTYGEKNWIYVSLRKA